MIFYSFYCFENISLFNRDGRLRIGDEIVNVNSQHLRGLQSYKTAQQLLSTFIDNCIDLVIAHDEVAAVSDFCTKIPVDRNSMQSEPHMTAEPALTLKKNYASASTSNLAASSRKRLLFEGRAHSTDSLSNVEICSIQTDITDGPPPNTEGNNAVVQSREKTLLGRRSLNRSLEMTPLFSTSEYTPVYADRVTISNTISDDEKWQCLSRKRAEALTQMDYAHVLGLKASTYITDNLTNNIRANTTTATNLQSLKSPLKQRIYNEIDLTERPSTSLINLECVPNTFPIANSSMTATNYNKNALLNTSLTSTYRSFRFGKPRYSAPLTSTTTFNPHNVISNNKNGEGCKQSSSSSSPTSATHNDTNEFDDGGTANDGKCANEVNSSLYLIILNRAKFSNFKSSNTRAGDLLPTCIQKLLCLYVRWLEDNSPGVGL